MTPLIPEELRGWGSNVDTYHPFRPTIAPVFVPHHGKYGIPEKILFIDRIPKTSVRKINKKALRERYGDT
jgi:acyl-CoA synthetase (AMP-forming)/AMP-acid ligase II